MIAIAAAPIAAGMIAVGVPGAAVAADPARVPAAGRTAVDARGAAVRAVNHGPSPAHRAAERIRVEAAIAAAVEAAESAAAPGEGWVDGPNRCHGRRRENDSQKLTLFHGLFPRSLAGHCFAGACAPAGSSAPAGLA